MILVFLLGALPTPVAMLNVDDLLWRLKCLRVPKELISQKAEQIVDSNSI